MEPGCRGLEGQRMPRMPDAFVEQVSARYIELYERLTGRRFERAATDELEQRIFDNVLQFLKARAPSKPANS